jgi:hypothetical protein
MQNASSKLYIVKVFVGSTILILGFTISDDVHREGLSHVEAEV